LGQSKHQFGTRLKEHQKAVSTLDKGKSALAEHVCYTKHEIAWENSKVITTNNRYGQRLCLEAWHINMSNHALNRDDGAYLPEEYMHGKYIAITYPMDKYIVIELNTYLSHVSIRSISLFST
jgi:hypothetical protein